MNIADLFPKKGDTFGFDQYTEYITQMHRHVAELFSPASPILGSVEPHHNYFNILEHRQLNHEPISPEAIIEEIAALCNGLPVWSYPGTMLNVIPPPNILSTAISNYISLLNANLSQDKYAGLLASAELEVVKYISELVNWDWNNSRGIFTFGGKGTIIYSLKCAINRAYPEGKVKGIYGKEFFFISSIKGHPCQKEVAILLGLGSDSCIKIGCSDDGKILLDKAYKIIKENINQGKIFLGFILSGGSTVEYEIDDIKAIAMMRDQIVTKYNLDYAPMVHVDAVVGWPWLFFKDYDFEVNKDSIDDDILQHIINMYIDISGLQYADSFGIDFHKMGFCPYITSLYMSKDRKDLLMLSEDELKLTNRELEYGNYAPFQYSIELTRSCHGPISALVALKSFGVKGYQQLIIKLLNGTQYFRQALKKMPYIELLNEKSRGVASLFIIKPPKYENCNLQQLLKLPFEATEEIKWYNVKLGDYIDSKCNCKTINFIFTATDAFAVNNTNVYLGMMKAYPMSPLVTNEILEEIVKQVDMVKRCFDNEKLLNLETIKHRPVDMVYRK